MQTIKTIGIHPENLKEFPSNDEIRKGIVKRIIDLFANGETEIKYSVFSDTGGKSPTIYKCVAKNIPIKTIDDCDFTMVGL
jgi:hypothetical protein